MINNERKICLNCCNCFVKSGSSVGKCRITNFSVDPQRDAEECSCYQVPQERLQTLPCWIGDTIYIVNNGSFKVEERKVKGFTLSESTITSYIDCFGVSVSFSNLGKTCFTDKAEADNVVQQQIEKAIEEGKEGPLCIRGHMRIQ